MPIRNVIGHVKEVAQTVENLTLADLKTELSGDSDILLLDIREIQELVDSGSVAQAQHVPRGMLEFWADPAGPYPREYFDESKRTIVFCAGGGRSVYAAKALQDMGYTNVASLIGGFEGWKKAGEPVHDFATTSRWTRR